MTYPPQSGGWPDQSGGGWPPQGQGGGWQAPDQEVYLDPASGQPTYLDPASGQPYPDPAGYPAVPQYSPAYAPYPAYPAVAVGPGRRTNGMSIASMVIAIVGLLTTPCYGIGLLIGLLGAIFGH